MKLSDVKYKLIWLVIGALIIRIIAALFVVDFNHPEMWEFGIIARSILNGEGFVYIALTQNVPSAYMPPALPYIYFVFFKILGDNNIAYFSILLLNSAIGSINIILIYRLALFFFNKQSAFYSAVYTAFSPIFIVSSISFTPIVYYHFFILLTLLVFKDLYFNKDQFDSTIKGKIRDAILLGVVLGCFMFFRAEIAALMILIAGLFFLRRLIIKGLLVLIVSLIVIAPWTYRNYLTFGAFVPIATSGGYNFFTGHGDDDYSRIYLDKLNSLTEDSTFELRQSEMAFDLGIDFIKNHPLEDIRESAKKTFSLWVFDLYRASSKNPLYLIVWIPTLALFIYGVFKSFKNDQLFARSKYLMYYFVFCTFFVILFFNIPRYQIQMSIVVVPFSMYGLAFFVNYLKNKLQLRK